MNSGKEAIAGDDKKLDRQIDLTEEVEDLLDMIYIVISLILFNKMI